jgi:NitT/TauT family transport system ATP-binding protein
MLFENTVLPDIIELKNISQKYGKVTVLENLNLLIENPPEKGRFVVVLGHSGCGKSTILRYIAGLQQPTSGEILIYGKLRTSLNLKDDHISMVFQQYSSLPWFSVLDNVALGLKFAGVGKDEREEKAMEIIKLVGLEGHENKYALYPILSGGQLQRVAIARSLLSNPKILLMDEPFGALDIQTRLNMQDLLASIWDKLKLTVIFVTHDISEAVYLADEVWLMSSNPGQIVDRIFDPLPYYRTKELKRTKQFTDLVYDIEDKMMQLKKK